MNLAPLFDAGWLVSSHALFAIAAFGLGTVQLIAPKGTLPHRTLGYIWCALMLWVVCAVANGVRRAWLSL